MKQRVNTETVGSHLKVDLGELERKVSDKASYLQKCLKYVTKLKKVEKNKKSCFSPAQYTAFNFANERYQIQQYGMVRYGTVWYGMVWYGMVWYGMVYVHGFHVILD